MRIHHYYPRTKNIGDHFVQIGIERLIREVHPDATFEFFDVNSRGIDKNNYGLTQMAVTRANQEADLVVVGGSNLYEGSLRWPWGVHLDVDALQNLRVPLFLMGIGAGSEFRSPLHRPSRRAQKEIRLLNAKAAFSGVRDVVTYDWLQQLGLTNVQLTGDPATFIMNERYRHNDDGHILITLPPRRFWTSKHQFWNVRKNGRAIFRALISLTRELLELGHKVIVCCNDPLDLPVSERLFGSWFPGGVVCPATPAEYFPLISEARAVISGRLHTAVVAFSAGVRFLVFDVDQRTHGFIETYQLESWGVVPERTSLDRHLSLRTMELLSESLPSWQAPLERRDAMHARSRELLRQAFLLA